MSLVLKQDVEIEDAYVARFLHNIDSAPTREDPHTDYPYLCAGGKLPEGPLHPIPALAFGMARFVLKCAKRGLLYTATPEGRWRFVHRLPDGRYEVDPGDGTPPFDAVIVGHQDPEVL